MFVIYLFQFKSYIIILLFISQWLNSETYTQINSESWSKAYNFMRKHNRKYLIEKKQ